MSYFILNHNRALNYLEEFKSDNLGFYFSFLFHFFILLSVIGLPNFFPPKQIYVPTIIPIEIINVTDITSIPEEKNESKSLEIKNMQLKEKKFNNSNNQEIKKIDIKKKPKKKENLIDEKILPQEKESIIIEEKKEKSLELEKQKVEINTNNFDRLPTIKIRPKLKLKSKINQAEKTIKPDVGTKPKPKTKPEPKINQAEKIIKPDVVTKPKPKTKPEPKINQAEKIIKPDVVTKPKPKTKPEPAFNMASMLKDLRNEKTIKKTKSNIEQKKNDIIEKPQKEKISEVAQLSITEIDLVLQQLSRCFIAPAGAEIKKSMFVKISAKIQLNRRVYENSIRIIDTNISKNSPLYGPITESAMRTLLNPECIPLKLPKEKYDLWKNLTMKFDYSIMRGN